MKEGLDFYYDGEYSVDMGLINVKMESGLFEEPFLAEKEILEVKVRGNDKPYYQGVNRSPLTFNLSFAFVDYYDESKLRKVARWLDKDYYKPFYTTDNTERIFYCMLYSSSELLHNGLKQGYVNIQMRCDSPYTYSPETISPVYEYNNDPVVISESSFQAGEFMNVAVSSEGLTLKDSTLKWNNYRGMKWSDIKPL